MRLATTLFLLGLVACGDETSTGPAGGADAEVTDVALGDADTTDDDASTDDDGATDPDAGVEVAVDADGDAAADAPTPDAVAGPTAVSLPQAIAGALWANPEVYASIPLRIAVEGVATEVRVALGASDVAAAPAGVPGRWVAEVPIAALADGMHALEVRATGSAAAEVTLGADLGIGRAGVQLTDFDVVGSAGAPRLHVRDDALWLTWTDRSSGAPAAWLRALDGAGRWTSEPVALLPDAGSEVLHARAAVGDGAIGVLYQRLGQPYQTSFAVVDETGAQLMAAIDLDPDGFHGAFSGDVAWDGSGFVVAWRVIDGAGGPSEVRWLRAAPHPWTVTGPTVLATAGPGTIAAPAGKFEPFSFIDIAAAPERSLVTFARHHYDTLLAMTIPRSHVAAVTPAGGLEYLETAVAGSDLTFHRECRAAHLGDGSFLAVWSALDLLDPATSPPNLLHATRTGPDGALDPSRGGGVTMFETNDDRDEVFVTAHPAHLAAMGWLDHRDYDAHGIRLFAAAVGDDLKTGALAVFPHARFVAGTSLLHGALAGENLVLVWLDERHGSGILDPRPEVYVETVWF